MSNRECIVQESRLDNGMLTVEMITPLIKVVILPEKGADIYSIQYKNRDHLDLLWKAPWGVSRPGTKVHFSPDSKQQWLDYYPGGWQVMFPNAGDECVYKGALYGFHGEASMVPWRYMIEQQGERVKVRFVTQLSRTPYQIERLIQLDRNTPAIHIEETISNLGEEEMHLEWGHHIAYGEPFIGEGCELQIPAKSLIGAVRDQVYSRLSAGKQAWPFVVSRGKELDFSKIPARNWRSTDFAVLCDLDDGWYALSNNNLGLTVGVAWDLEVLPYVWLWQEFQGLFQYPFYGRCYVMGVEPCSTLSEKGLPDSIEKGVSIRIQPLETKSLTITMVLIEGAKNVAHISLDGQVGFEPT